MNKRVSNRTSLAHGGASLWTDEKLTSVPHRALYNTEKLAKERGADYIRWKRPYRGSAAATNGLVTGHNNSSSGNLVASSVCEELERLDSLKAKGSEPL